MSSTTTQLGRVTQALPGGGEARPGQQEMAELVAKSVERGIMGDLRTTLVQAGTGTGKSLAYLVPIVAAGRKAIIATATIALQGQLLSSDLPKVADAIDDDLTFALLKGRNNYACAQRLAELDRSDTSDQLDLLGGTSKLDELRRVREWAADSATGDREELDPAPPADVWRAISVGADECPGAARCPSGGECFSEQARTEAMEAQVVITNHHYYGLDLAAGGVLLPEHDVVVFDEAHHLPEVIGATNGTEISGGRLRALGKRIRGLLTDDKPALQLDRSALDLDDVLGTQVGRRIDIADDLLSLLVTARDRLDTALAALRKIDAPDGSDASARAERAVLGATNLIDACDQLLASGDDDVCWIDGNRDRPVLRRTPLDVGAILTERLWGQHTAILTSATLPPGLADQLGLVGHPSFHGGTVHDVPSPFDYEERGVLYCATHLPEPRHPDYRQAVRDEMVRLIEAAGGRTLGLFTSSSAMQEAAEDLRDRLDLTVMVQGEQSKARLIEAFQAEPSAVLLATLSFWQGVDLPGDTLTLVTIDRLPFPRPDDPVLSARRDAAGPAAFRTVDLPRAQILLAQAAGRLIRRGTDRGVVAVLDNRLATKRSYRWELIGALPPMRREKDPDEVAELLRAIDAEARAADVAR
ncbi:MAG: ATP-dependent DNA helicase [Acidimicrobiales bacterium]